MKSYISKFEGWMMMCRSHLLVRLKPRILYIILCMYSRTLRRGGGERAVFQNATKISTVFITSVHNNIRRDWALQIINQRRVCGRKSDRGFSFEELRHNGYNSDFPSAHSSCTALGRPFYAGTLRRRPFYTHHNPRTDSVHARLSFCTATAVAASPFDVSWIRAPRTK